ncbi:MAG: hypothetical protein WD055_00290 [Candidatus Dependentiae bacterium]
MSLRTVQYTYIVLLCMFLLSVGTSYSGDNEQPDAESTNIEQELQKLCDVPSRREDYFTQLIKREPDIQNLPDGEDKERYLTELDQAKNVLPDAQKRKLYGILGHQVYTDLYTRNNLVPNIDLIQYFQDLSTTDNLEPLRKAVELYGILVEEVPIENALNRLTPSRNRNEQEEKKYKKLNEHQKKVFRALGPILYKKITKNELNKLTTFAQTHDEAEILKNMLNETLCKFEQTEKQKNETGKTKTPGQQEISAPQQRPTPTVVKGKAPENIDKANAKLSSALRSLQNAKRWLKGIDRQERTNIKKRVENILKENATGIQQMANRIKQLKHIPSNLKNFEQTVQKINAEFKSI